MRRNVLTFGLFALVLLLSCQEASWRESAARERFEAFMRHAVMQEFDKALELVAKPDRERILEPLKKLRREHEDAPLTEEDIFAISYLESPRSLEKIEIPGSVPREPKHGNILEMKLHYLDGRKASAKMWWSGRDWFVKLY